MSFRSDILLLGSDLSLGESTRVLCPVCEGGSGKELSLVITRGDDGNLLWICHRASCPTQGGEGGSTVSTLQPTSKPRKKFTGNTIPLSDSHKERIRSLWGIVDPPHWYWTNDYGGRVAMSIRSPKYTHRGWVLRDIRGRSKIKALTYIDEGEEALSWYKTDRSACTVLVEDIPSAVRSAEYVNSVALIGTAIGTTRAAEIAEHAPRPIVIALDQDATALAFRYARKYALLWDSPQVLMLNKDIKNMTKAEIEQLLGGGDA